MFALQSLDLNIKDINIIIKFYCLSLGMNLELLSLLAGVDLSSVFSGAPCYASPLQVLLPVG